MTLEVARETTGEKGSFTALNNFILPVLCRDSSVGRAFPW